jgi:pyrophosphatase PpaX
MPRYRTVLFDLDGTLLDSIRLILDSFHHTFAVFELPPRSDAEWLQGIGTPLSTQFAPWARDAAQLEAMVAAYRRYNLEHHDDRVTPYPGVERAVEALRREGVRIGVVTSKGRSTAQRGLRVAGIEAAVDALVGAEDVTNPKPHREPVDRALALLGAPAASAIFVGDSVHDMRAGRAAAVPTGAALWGPFGRADLEESEPTHWLASLEELVQLVLA